MFEAFKYFEKIIISKKKS